MKLFGILSFTLLLSALTNQAEAQFDSVKHFSLAEAQQYALDNFYMSKNAELDIEAAKWKVWETTAIGLPQVSASGEYQRYLDDLPDPISFPRFDENGNFMGTVSADIFQKENFSLGVNVSQLIFSGEYIVGLQASKVYKLMSEEGKEKTDIEIKQSVAETYYGLLILKSNREILVKTLENLKDNLEQLQKSFDVGMVEETDVDQIDLSVKRTENQLRSLDRQIEYMSNMFNYQIGLSPDVTIKLKDNLDQLINQNIIEDSTYTFVLDNNIDYKILNTQEELQRLALNREKSQYLPSLSGFYNYNAVLNNTAFTPPQNMVGVRANWTLFQSGMRSAKIAEARIEYEKVQNQKEQESNRLSTTAEQALFDYRTALEEYNNEKENFILSERVYSKTEEKHKQGMVSSLELSLINNQYLQAQLSYSMAVQQLLSAKVKLDKAYNKL